jgi:hypothetical protein
MVVLEDIEELAGVRIPDLAIDRLDIVAVRGEGGWAVMLTQ